MLYQNSINLANKVDSSTRDIDSKMKIYKATMSNIYEEAEAGGFSNFLGGLTGIFFQF